MLNWIVWNRTDCVYKMDLALNNLQDWYAIKPEKPDQTCFVIIHKIKT